VLSFNNGDATEQDIANEKAKVEDKYNTLKQAIANLTPDVSPLECLSSLFRLLISID
jgi:hypothetical protein